MRFVETPIFTRAVASLLSDEEYRQLQLALLARPEPGALIRGRRRIAKTAQDNMTPAQLRVLRRLVQEEFR
jgi:PHD/YefM family antitoxin component YafN of YafNO toxin-antitoxin module